MRKLQNRMEFGKAEEETGVDDEVVGLGMIGASSGRVRGETVDARSKGGHGIISRFACTSGTRLADSTFQPNCHGPTRFERKCWAGGPLPTTQSLVWPHRSHTPLFRASRLSRRRSVQLPKSNRPTRGGLQAAHSRMSRVVGAVSQDRASSHVPARLGSDGMVSWCTKGW